MPIDVLPNFQLLLSWLGYRYRGRGWRKVLYYGLYTPFIFAVTCLPLVFALIEIMKTGNQIVASSVLFHLIIPIQFILGVRYFQSNHFSSTLMDCRCHGKKLPPDAFIVGLCLIVAIVINTVTVSIMLSGRIAEGFDLALDGLHGETRSFVMFLMVIMGMINWTILATNLVVFWIVFHKHVEDMHKMKKYVEGELVWKLDQYSLSNLTREIVSLRYVISQSVDRLESFYTTTTILGALAIGPILELRRLDPYLILYLVIYGLLQLHFLYFIYTISKNREDILKVIKSPKIMHQYLVNIKSMHNVNALRMQAMGSCHQSHNPQEMVVATSHKITSYSLGSQSEEAEDALEDGKSLEGSPIELELLSLEYKNNAIGDWLVLKLVLDEKWTNFNLMGMTFNDSNVIKKSVSMTSLIILVSTYLNSLHLL